MKEQNRTAVVAALIAIIATAAGCSSEVAGKPSATSSAGSDSASATPSRPTEQSAPRVGNPLDTTKFESAPCHALNGEQLAAFKATGPGTPDRNSDGNLCTWSAGSDHSASISVLFTTAVTNGLSNTYDLNSAGAYKAGYFEPTEVAGYPGVFNDVADTRSGGGCHLVVGTSDQRILGVLIQGRAGTDGCKAATNVAQAVLNTVKAGQ